MKYVTGGSVGQIEAGGCLAQVIYDLVCTDRGIQQIRCYTSDGKPCGAGGAGGEIFKNTQSDAVGIQTRPESSGNLV